MRTYEGSQAYQRSQAYLNVNGKVLQDQVIQADYDGKNLAIDIYDKGKHFYSNLNNSDIASILSQKASALPLEKRLRLDFGVEQTRKRKSKKKKSKSKKNK